MSDTSCSDGKNIAAIEFWQWTMGRDGGVEAGYIQWKDYRGPTD
jgi:hypothetical protein